MTKEFVVEKLKAAVIAASALPFYKVVGVNAITLSNMAGAFCAQNSVMLFL